MIHVRFIKDIIQDIINDMNFDIIITAVTNNGGGSYTITVCDVKHFQIGFQQTIGETTYTITSVDYDLNTVTMTGNSLPSVGTIEIYNPYFFHGTINQTNAELSRITQLKNKTPMIYLYESIDESFNYHKENNIERISNLRIFFLTQSNFEDWETTDYYSYALKPMRYLMDNFLLSLKNSSVIGRFNEYTSRNHTRFGVFVTDKGYELNYFSDHLSGIELNINLPIVRETCDDGC